MLTLCKNATMVEKSIRKYSTPAVDASLHRKKTKKNKSKVFTLMAESKQFILL